MNKEAQFSKNRIAAGLLAVAAGGLTLPNAKAEEIQPVALEEVVVTASRRVQTLQDTALSVTSIQPEQFARGGLTSLRDITEYTPGVQYSGGGAPTENTISMRGVSSLTASPTVGVYIDDVPIGSGNSQAAGAELALDVVMADVERIELIKGPQGTLYGASSMGGLIRYITRDASTGEMSGAVATDISSTKRGGVNQKYSGRVNLPLVKDKIGLSISGYLQDNEGFIDRIPEASTGAAEDVNGFDSDGILGKLTANFTDQFTGSLMGFYTKTEFGGRNVITLEGKGPEGGAPFELAHGRYETDTSEADENFRFTLYAGTLQYELPWATVVSSTSYQESESTEVSDLVTDFGPLIELFSGTGAGSVTNAPFTGGQFTDRLVQEFRLLSTDSDSFEWSIGAIYSKEESSNIQKLEGLPIDFLLLDVDIPSELEEYAGFGNLTYYLTPNLDITGGIRIAKVETSVEVVDGPQIIVANTPPQTSSGDIDTYSFALRYRPLETMSLYGRVASGYRPETANLPLLRDGVNVAPPIIDTDTLWSYELGAKGTLNEAKISYDIALYYIDWENLQARIFVEGAITGGNANSDVTAQGLEATFGFYPLEGLSILTSLAYADSSVDDDETSAFGALSGEKMPGVPEWTASLRADYTFIMSDNMEGFVGGGFRYTGDINAGFMGGESANGTIITPIIQNFVLDSYTIVDIHAGVTVGNITGTLYASNLLDEYAFSGGGARPAAGFVRATANAVTPRTIGATLKYKF